MHGSMTGGMKLVAIWMFHKKGFENEQKEKLFCE